jgi:hypothetical protein
MAQAAGRGEFPHGKRTEGGIPGRHGRVRFIIEWASFRIPDIIDKNAGKIAIKAFLC